MVKKIRMAVWSLGLLMVATPRLANAADDLKGCSGPTCLDEPSGTGGLGIIDVTINKGVAGIIEVLLTAAGFLAVIFVIIGGIRYASSNGNPTAVNDAKQTITYAIIGLVVAITARLIVGFVVASLPK